MCKQVTHFFSQSISHISLPEKFTYPFHYIPHQLCVLAAEEVKSYIGSHLEWKEELSLGKMFGVLIVQDHQGTVSYLAAFSGNLAGKNVHPYFVPPVYDLLQPEGFFKIEEKQISNINRLIKELETNVDYLTLKEKLKEESTQATLALAEAKAKLKSEKEERELRRRSSQILSETELAILIKESQHQKANLKRLERKWKKQLEEREAEITLFEKEIEHLKTERKERSATLQKKLFEQFRMLNAKGEVKDLFTIFAETIHRIPPAGTGECALPKLLQYAYLEKLKPLAMAEFWWGNSPKTEIRHHGYYYPSCRGKCAPILQHMLHGLEVEENPLLSETNESKQLEILFEDEWLLVVNKPVGMLSVPGKVSEKKSVYSIIRKKYPQATGPMIVHRLDMATSGLLVVAKTKEVHQHLQAQFKNRTVKKEYTALLDKKEKNGEIRKTGRIELPLCPNPLDRPRQMVSKEYGKTAITDYKILEISEKHIRINFFPLTGRTHQLRVHAAHAEGLGCPIIGDELYGKRAERLYLHAEYIEFRHPVNGKVICTRKAPNF